MKRRKLIAIITFLLILMLAFFVYKNISIEKKKDEYQDYTPQEEISEEQSRQTKVTLYFENIDTGELETEIKVMDANILINNPEEELINLLINLKNSNPIFSS